MSSRQRTRSRSCSRSTDGIVTSVNSPAANNLASRIASRVSVFTRSVGGRSVLPGAHTPSSIPSAQLAAPTHSPSGPPHTPSAPAAGSHKSTGKTRADDPSLAASAPRLSPAQRPRPSTDARARPDRPNGYRQTRHASLDCGPRAEAVTSKRRTTPHSAGGCRPTLSRQPDDTSIGSIGIAGSRTRRDDRS